MIEKLDINNFYTTEDKFGELHITHFTGDDATLIVNKLNEVIEALNKK